MFDKKKKAQKGAKIGAEDIRKATEILEKYKEGKQILEKKIVENEKWYRLQHFDHLNADSKESATSAWMFNSLANKHADALDNYPRPNIRPREATDSDEAKVLSSIVPVLLDMMNFEETYSKAWWYKLKNGVVPYGIFWDSTAHNGIGDIQISKCDILNIFWMPGVTDIQKSPNLFYLDVVKNDALISAYPHLEGKLGGKGLTVSEYVQDDSIDTSDCSIVVEWYYKKKNSRNKTVLHYCKYVNDEILFATENETKPYITVEGEEKPSLAEVGLYEHGLYPFVFDVLYPEEGTPYGFGFIDICKSPQKYIDKLNQSMLEYARYSSKPRIYQKISGGVNEAEFCNPDVQVVHTNNMSIGETIGEISPPTYNPQLNSLLEFKIQELKETSGNRDVNNGGTSGTTTASGIAAQIEAGSKLSRDMIKASYRTYREIITMVVELIRQYYSIERSFRIIGEGGQEEFIRYSNKKLANQKVTDINGVEYSRKPVFDIDISAEKSSPYARASQNEMMINFFRMGFFNPQMAEQALLCLDGMDFDGKDNIIASVQKNAMMQQTLITLAQMLIPLAQATRPELLPQIQQILAQSGLQQMMPSTGGGQINLNPNGESSVTQKARLRTAEATNPQ